MRVDYVSTSSRVSVELCRSAEITLSSLVIVLGEMLNINGVVELTSLRSRHGPPNEMRQAWLLSD